jgi:hypothetical protein
MKAFLMHRERDFDLARPLPVNEEALTQDLELTTLLEAMANGDAFLFDVAKRGLLLSLTDPEAIAYRQEVLGDCLRNPSVASDLYLLAWEAIRAERSVWSSVLRDAPRSLLSSSVNKMELLVAHLRRLREIAGEHAGEFRSDGFRRFFAMVADELDDQYFALVDRQLKVLAFKGGMLMSAGLGSGNKGVAYVLRRPRDQSLLGRILNRPGYGFAIPDRDENGFRALGDLMDKAANPASNALAQSVEHVLSFFVMLRAEIGFYVGCANLSAQLERHERPTAIPVALAAGEPTLIARDLYDVSLSLVVDEAVVANDIDAAGKALVIITGANQGGKSTLLRSIGLAQLMMQCGMFVTARALEASVCGSLFTHYKREEDESMESGKLDEELARMSEIVDHIEPGSMLLCNESFAATNEREGSQIAREVVKAMTGAGVKVLFVTHMFDLANGFFEEQSDDALFIRAQRGGADARPYKLTEGRPWPTSYGEDSYRKIFGNDPHAPEHPHEPRRAPSGRAT